MKNVFKNWHLPRYLASVYTSRSVLISFGIFVGGILGLEFFNYIELELYKSFGPAILPITTLPNAILTLAVIGGLIGFWVSQIIAANRFFQPKDEAIKQNPVLVPEPVIATPVAPIVPAPVIYKFPYTIPAGTGWQNVSLEFLDDEHVLIRVDRWRHRASYIDFDMADKRAKTTKPGKQWLLLKILADLGGEISFDDSEAKVSLKKQKQMLSYKLKQYFGIDFDPFDPYKQEHKYKIKSVLVPFVDDGKPMVRDSDKSKFFTDDEPMEEGIPEPVSDEKENLMAQESILDEEEAKRYGYSISGG